MTSQLKVIISGASGLIGKPLVANLRKHGHQVTNLVRRSPNTNESQWDPSAGKIDERIFNGADMVINLSGAGIGDRRWTSSYKREILESRIMSTALLANTIASVANGPRVFLSGSAIGIYGPCGDEVLTESSNLGTSFLADVCAQWEAATKPATAAGVRTVLLRTGIVLTPAGGALKKQLPIFKLGLGGKFGNGKQWQSWISLDDEIAAIEHLLTANVSGPVNLTAPNPVTNAEFASTLGRVLKRFAKLPVPKIFPRALLGSELADALLFTGQRVVPEALQKSNFVFRHNSIEVALRMLLNK